MLKKTRKTYSDVYFLTVISRIWLGTWHFLSFPSYPAVISSKLLEGGVKVLTLVVYAPCYLSYIYTRFTVFYACAIILVRTLRCYLECLVYFWSLCQFVPML